MKIVKILIVCLINLQAYAQIVEFQGHQSGGNPWNRRIDTVTFGFSAGAKLGIDEAYGEENVKMKIKLLTTYNHMKIYEFIKWSN